MGDSQMSGVVKIVDGGRDCRQLIYSRAGQLGRTKTAARAMQDVTAELRRMPSTEHAGTTAKSYLSASCWFPLAVAGQPLCPSPSPLPLEMGGGQ